MALLQPRCTSWAQVLRFSDSLWQRDTKGQTWELMFALAAAKVMGDRART